MSGGPLEVDVLISGAGPVGGLLALRLAQGGLGVGVVDPHLSLVPKVQETVQDNVKEDWRMYAIAQGLLPFLETVGLWQRIASHAAPIQTIRTTLSRGKGLVIYRAEDVGAEALGWMVPSALLRRALAQLLEEGGATLWQRATRIGNWKAGEEGVDVSLDDHPSVRTKLLIGAEGRHSPLREQVGGSILKGAYDHVALVGTVAHTQDHCQTAFEHFTPDGPLALLPCQGRHAAVVWSVKAPRAEALLAEPQLFLHALVHHFGWGLGDLRLVTPLQGHPTALTLPLRVVAQRVALVGDAAHVLHPLAGQGLNLGLRDAASLSQAILQAYRLGLDWGGSTVLSPWARTRRMDHWSLAGLTHGLVRLFEKDHWLLNKTASLGFRAVEGWAPLKTFFMHQAMGLSKGSHREPDAG